VVVRILGTRLAFSIPYLMEYSQPDEPTLLRLFLRLGDNRESKMAARL